MSEPQQPEGSTSSVMNEYGASSSGGKLELMHLIERLKLQKRTGWVREGINLPESIADHMYRMAMLSLLSEEDEQLDIGKCVQMAVVHDLAEASVGDITPFDGVSKEEKEKLEHDAMKHITSVLLDPKKPASRRIKALYEEYERRETREAKFVKDLDLLEMALQAFEYEKEQKSGKMQPFFRSSIPKIKHPEVQKWAHELMEERRKNSSDYPSYEQVSISGQQEGDAPLQKSAPQAPHPVISLASSAVRVLDADDEIFDLYSALSASTPVGSSKSDGVSKDWKGLGFVDSKTGLLQVSIEVPMQKAGAVKPPASKSKRRSSSSTSGIPTEKLKQRPPEMQEIEAEIQQDLSGLKRRPGDTGSVVWRASIELARLVLTQIHALETRPGLLDYRHIATSSVVELGSGTGILSVLLSPYFKSWACTDIPTLLPLIQKNHTRNTATMSSRASKAGAGSATLEVLELDWTWTRKQLLREFGPNEADYDILLAVDCLFNESLVQPFVNTLDAVNAKVVIIASELRSPEVPRLFLESWLKSGQWEIWRACKDSDNDEARPLLAKRYVVWVAWRQARTGEGVTE